MANSSPTRRETKSLAAAHWLRLAATDFSNSSPIRCPSTGDEDEYCTRILQNIGLRNSMVVETHDGRSIQIVNEPLADGGWVATHEDITERRLAEEQIRHLAHYDALTNLPNRALFHEKLKQELARTAAGGQVAVLYIDIDEFKSVNHTLGHLIGDEMLKSVAVSLSQ